MRKRLLGTWPVSSFLAITFGFTWGLHVPGLALGMEASWVSWGLITAGALGPLVGALVVIGVQGHSVSESEFVIAGIVLCTIPRARPFDC